MAQLDNIDRQIIRCLSGDIAGDKTPYRSVAEKVGVSEDEVLDRIEGYRQSGALRRLGAIVNHSRAGFSANGMVVWNVPDSMVDDVGPIMASFDEVTHCYVRLRHPDWVGNLYTMVHGSSEDVCRDIARHISERTGVSEYRILFSSHEFKKTSMTYFASGDE